MNIETLRIFCDVVQHQSFSRGAAANEVSQSAATQSVHRMEQHFSVQLVDRSKRPFVLTPEGQACYEGFREVLYARCGKRSPGWSAWPRSIPSACTI
jgi:DNA-binding transcriptional LysR family regulator